MQATEIAADRPAPAMAPVLEPVEAPVVAPSRWRVADGLDQLGPVQGSGLRESTHLVRRRDGQVVQLSQLLHLVLSHVRADRLPEHIAQSVSDDYGRTLDVDGLEHLLSTRLLPLGLVTRDLDEADRADADLDSPPVEAASAPALKPTDVEVAPRAPTSRALRYAAKEAPLPTAQPLLSLVVARASIVPARWVPLLAELCRRCSGRPSSCSPSSLSWRSTSGCCASATSGLPSPTCSRPRP